MTSDSQKAALIRNDIPVPFQFPLTPRNFHGGFRPFINIRRNLLSDHWIFNQLPELITAIYPYGVKSSLKERVKIDSNLSYPKSLSLPCRSAAEFCAFNLNRSGGMQGGKCRKWYPKGFYEQLWTLHKAMKS
nr:hypothetical protein [uncultured Cohaesibacter sp.]